MPFTLHRLAICRISALLTLPLFPLQLHAKPNFSAENSNAPALCDSLAAPPRLVDPDTPGSGIDRRQINVRLALPACAEAASTSNPRYIALYSVVLEAARQYPEAIKQARRAADKGNAFAMLELGLLYSSNQSGVRNAAESAAWLRKAADAGNAFAMNEVGENYLKGTGEVKSAHDAETWFRRSAELGNPLAMNNLGDMYTATQNFSEAASWYRKSAEVQDPWATDSAVYAMDHLAYLYHTGKGVPRSAQDAATWYQKAADHGDGYGMYNIGVFYQTGWGKPRSFPDAASWYEKALQKNYDRAAVNLGVLYENGWGVIQDRTKP